MRGEMGIGGVRAHQSKMRMAEVVLKGIKKIYPYT